MPIMMEKLYDALRAADVSDEKARAAAVEAADFTNRLNTLETRLTKIEAELTTMKWMLGFNLAFVVAITFKIFMPGVVP
jgi:hypothetical protein